MRIVIYSALLLAAPAVAEPIAPSKPCQVTIARAPDDVRAVVEQWVHSEAQCNVALEIRIVPTEGGLYLLAQDDSGGTRERIVPDAQTAGVLVASWIADDNAPPPPPPPPRPAVAPPRPMPVVAPASESLTPPGLAPVSITATAPSPRSPGKWVSVAGMAPLAPGGELGVRAELDAIRRGRWTLGAAGSLSESEMDLASSSGYGTLTTMDARLIAYVARTWSFGRWQIRPAIGAGLVYTDGFASDGYNMYSLNGAFITGEASSIVSRELGTGNWAAYAGMNAALMTQNYDVWTSGEGYPVRISRSALDLSLLAGVRKRL